MIIHRSWMKHVSLKGLCCKAMLFCFVAVLDSVVECWIGAQRENSVSIQ